MSRITAAKSPLRDVERGSGNVFADLGIPDALELNTKTLLAVRLVERIKALGLRQADIAKILGTAQPNVSALLNYRLDNFSSDKLLEFFNALGYDVDVRIQAASGSARGAIQVRVTA